MGALINGVFLVALCLSIFLEAIQRFVQPQSVVHPELVLGVGFAGLLSNILGLFLFHEHGHTHGSGNGHSHGGLDNLADAEEGHAAPAGHTQAVADEGGNVADVLPQSTVAGWPKSSKLRKASKIRDPEQPANGRRGSNGFSRDDEDGSTAANSTSSPLSVRRSHASSTGRRRRQNSAGSRSRFSSVDDLHIHPASFRNDIIAASRESRLEDIESGGGSGSEGDEAEEESVVEEEQGPTEASPLLGHAKTNGSAKGHHRRESLHAGHTHNQSKSKGQSHGDLNMRGVFLHVMGDALGNIGVIGSALFIWLTNYSWRFYADPAISIVITGVILASAIPLCKAASRILLQAAPVDISIDDIKRDIEELPGILSCHHLHVWQLSDVKMIASLHVQVEFDFKGEGSARYMALAKQVRRCLHGHGIHSSTIQPEFCLDSEHRHVSSSSSDHEGSDSVTGGPRKKVGSRVASKAGSLRSEPEACLLDCGDDCDEAGQCCAPNATEADTHNENGHSH